MMQHQHFDDGPQISEGGVERLKELFSSHFINQHFLQSSHFIHPFCRRLSPPPGTVPTAASVKAVSRSAGKFFAARQLSFAVFRAKNLSLDTAAMLGRQEAGKRSSHVMGGLFPAHDGGSRTAPVPAAADRRKPGASPGPQRGRGTGGGRGRSYQLAAQRARRSSLQV